ncbi:MAG: SusC/RagA family TonB-linked outer membrane protein [Chitinophagaceae bacterium]
MMKLTAFLLLVACMHVSAKGFTQNVTLHAKNESLKKVFTEIRRQTGYLFFVNEALLDKASRVTVQLKNAPLEKALDDILKEQSLTYSILGNTIVVKPKTIVLNGNPSDSALTSEMMPPYPPIHGKVTDTTGQPMSNVTVMVKGTQHITVTDENGTYTFSDVDADNAVLLFRFIGYGIQEVALHGRTELNVVLKVQVQELEELEVVVSTGYQTIPKERTTGAFAAVSTMAFQQQRLNSLSSLLEGRVAGYQNGLIRGTTSMNGQTTPLYVVDNFPVENSKADEYGGTIENLPNLNLEDIESITVLKDAAAASIYGARAANGVIVITTKKGKIGKPQISVSNTFTTQPYRYYTGNLTSAGDVIDLEKEWAASNPNLQGSDAMVYAQSLLDNAVYPNQGIRAILQNYAGILSDGELSATLNNLAGSGYSYYRDVEKYSKRNPFYQQYNMNVGTSTGKNSFYGSVTYKNNAQEDKFTSDEQVGVNLKNNIQLAKWLTAEVSTYWNYLKGQSQTYNTLSPGFQYQPYDRLVNADGSEYTNTAAYRLSTNTNTLINSNGLYSMDITPLEEQALNLSQSKSINNRSVISFKANITDWLSYNPSFQYEYMNNRNEVLYDKKSYYVRNLVNQFASPASDGGNATFNLPYGYIDQTQNQFTNAYNFRQQLNVDKDFARKHHLTAIAGSEIRDSKMEFDSKYQYNYDPQVLTSTPVDEVLLSNFYNGILGYPSFDRGSRSEITRRFVSFYGNAGYSYQNKYLLTTSARWDRSNLWGTSSKYQNKPIWSVGAGWNIEKEDFFHVDWVNQLKLRFTHGTSGNVDPNNSPFITESFFPNYNVGEFYGIIGNRPNPLLSWELTTTNNIGTDFRFFHDRLSGSIDLYNKKGKNLLANTQGVPTEGYGYATYQINNGQMLNKGLEVVLNGDVIHNQTLQWNLGVQYAYNQNKVTYVDVAADAYYLQLDYPTAYPRIGNPYQAVYSYRWAGLDNSGQPQVYNETGEKTTISPGTVESLIYSGTTVPKYSGGINSSLTYKGFSFSFLLTFEGGHVIRNTFLPYIGNSYNNDIGGYTSVITAVNKGIVDRWKQPGDEQHTNIPKAVFAEDEAFNSESYDLYRYADINVLNAANIRLRNVSIVYQLPSSFSKKIKIQHARIQFNIENALMLTKDKTVKYLLNGYQRPNYMLGVYFTL